MPDTCERALQGHQEPQGATEAPAFDISLVRRMAAQGTPIPADVMHALCERVERAESAAATDLEDLRRAQDEVRRWKGQASLRAENIATLTKERDHLLAVALAWANAIQSQDVDEIQRTEGELIALVEALRP